MACSERARLEEKLARATHTFEAADRAFKDKLGITSAPEYRRLNRVLGSARKELQQVRLELNRHIQTHGCGGKS